MASLRRSKALSPDGQTARFLYTILKQLDLKAIDWNLVADGLEITNGHAARMRFSRFKQHMEGIPSQPRNPRPKKEGVKDSKNAKAKGLKRGLDGNVKQEGTKGEDDEADEANIKPEPGRHIKAEPGMEESSRTEEPAAARVKREPETDGVVSQPDSQPRYLASPGDGHELVATTNPTIAPLAMMTTEATPSIVPPMATVSLADLHLSTASIPSAPRFDRPAPSFVFAPKPGNRRAPGDAAATGIKSEPGLTGSTMLAASGQAPVKSEPTDL